MGTADAQGTRKQKDRYPVVTIEQRGEARYWIDDVINVFATTFCGNRMIGGLKCFSNRRRDDTEAWVIHARYLLTVATEEHIEMLMLAALHPQWVAAVADHLI